MQLKRGEPIGKTLFFMDEASMLDVETFGEFALAVLQKCSAWQICLVGDEGQLPPIGRGECFRTAVLQNKRSDILIRLEKCYRASFVQMFNFHLAVRDGTLPSGDGDVVVVKTVSTDDQIFNEVKRIVAESGSGTTYIAWKNEHVDMINRWVQAKVTGRPSDGYVYNVGDRVVYVGENKPRDRLTNALCGIVTKALKTSAVVRWDHGELSTVYNRDVRLAYCLTVHKAQGSGFDRVCVACPSGAAMLTCLDRRWLYTAVSRARKHLTVVCTAHTKELAERPTPSPGLSSLFFGVK